LKPAGTEMLQGTKSLTQRDQPAAPGWFRAGSDPTHGDDNP
jgi:hypothetical protein